MVTPQFIWCDLSAYRPAKAQAFYKAVLGWEFENEDYANAFAGDDPVAAIYQMPEKFQTINMPSFWMSYIAVASVPETVATAKSAGAKIELEEDFGDGHIALIRDPLGAGFTIYQGDMPAGATGKSHGARAGHALMVSDTSVAAFYEDVFGWTVQPNGAAAQFMADGMPIAELHEASEEHRGGFEYWAIAFAVDDLNTAANIYS